MRRYSIIIPVYNRPDEIRELLETLTRQTYRNFEVLVIEDGSVKKCDAIVDQFSSQLDIRYFYKENSGQGFSRNYGFERATGDYFVIFDSDCLIPEHYFATVEAYLNALPLDAYGGPDRAHLSFTPVQKAISYSMTSLFTTGGIRGNKKRVGGPFHPRSFNMGLSRKVYETVGGYIITRMGEDIIYTISIIEHGFKTGLIEDAYVYHKRRTSFSQFYKQLHFFGRARINISRYFPKELKTVHTFPALFTLFCMSIPLLALFSGFLFKTALVLLGVYILLIFIDATRKNQSLQVGILSTAAVFVQLFGYGIGFLTEGWRKLTKSTK
ncbi:glycosyltransferase [Rhodocytophaga rosea]|uniref:Glycosyltransferase n=1 Tax=Rhodocytophaga rosea TaxID=2704465 RepID=A0A6C0GQ21_9BACT|nr:glycosyltransferase [Rhodocytophaga rosea]QHT69620.1 glycosyltransferase [Rhodocytophaga rosea]